MKVANDSGQKKPVLNALKKVSNTEMSRRFSKL